MSKYWWHSDAKAVITGGSTISKILEVEIFVCLVILDVVWCSDMDSSSEKFKAG